MSLLALPFAIAGALAALVPVAIHLLWRQRRRPIPWAAMRFVQQAWRRHRRRHRLEQWLLLAARALVLLLFGLALARPVLDGGGPVAGGRDLWLVIDDSVTSGVRTADEDGRVRTALERSVAEARREIDALGPGSRAAVVTVARPAAARLQPPTADLAAVRRLLEDLEPRPVPADLPGAILALNRHLGAEGTGRPATVRLLGELRRGTADPEAALPRLDLPEGRRVRLVADPPATTAPVNVTVAEVRPDRSIEVGGEALGGGRVTVELERTGSLGAGRSTVRLDGRFARPVPPATVEWRSGQAEATATFAVEFEPGIDAAVAVVARVGDDALPAGDARASVVEVRTALSVLLVDRRRIGEGGLDRLPAATWIERALRPVTDAPIDVRRLDPASVEPVDLATADAVVVVRPDLLDEARWSLLEGHVRDGGLLVLTPAGDARVQRWTDELARFGLDWTVRREIREEPGGLAVDPEAAPPRILSAIASELPDLARPVVALRRMVIEPGPAADTSILPFTDGSPLLAVAPPASREPGGPGPGSAPADPADPADPVDPVDRSAPRDGDAAAGEPTGLVVLLAVSPRLDWTNLPAKPLMVPLVQELVRQGAGLVRSPGGVPAGTRPRITRPRSADRLVAPEGRVVLLGADRRPEEPLREPGTWTMLDAGGREVGRLGVHVEAEATRVDPNAAEPVRTWLAASGPWRLGSDAQAEAGTDGTAPARTGGAGLARLLLAAVLALLALETVMARRFSHAAPARSTGQAVRSGRRPPVRATIEQGSGGPAKGVAAP